MEETTQRWRFLEINAKLDKARFLAVQVEGGKPAYERDWKRYETLAREDGLFEQKINSVGDRIGKWNEGSSAMTHHLHSTSGMTPEDLRDALDDARSEARFFKEQMNKARIERDSAADHEKERCASMVEGYGCRCGVSGKRLYEEGASAHAAWCPEALALQIRNLS